ncbi:MAG: heavy-metal-associated domain-containing protein [Burkholderiales bacterium]
METTLIEVKGMTCGGCVRSVTRVLETVPGVKSADVSLERGEARVSFDPALASLAQIRGAIEDAGYQAR